MYPDKPSLSKMFKVEDLPGVIDYTDNKIVHAHGCFDLFHAGHVKHLEEAAGLGDVLVVTITDDDYVFTSKGAGHPLFSQYYRSLVIAALECVDFVAINHERDASKAIRIIRPNIFVKGKEYLNDETPQLAEERKAIAEVGGKLFFTSGVKLSSTATLEKLTLCV